MSQFKKLNIILKDFYKNNTVKKILRLKESELIKLISEMISEQSGVPMLDPTKIPGATFKPRPSNAMNPQGGVNQFTQQKLNIGCVIKTPETKKTIKGYNGEVFTFLSDGTFVDAKNQKGKYVCGNQANIVNLMYDSDPKAVKYFNMSPQPVKPAIAKAKPDPKVIELQKQIKVALPNFNLGTSGPNKDGIDGIMGPRTKEGQRQMIQIKGQQSLQNLSNQGQKLVNSFKQYRQ